MTFNKIIWVDKDYRFYVVSYNKTHESYNLEIVRFFNEEQKYSFIERKIDSLSKEFMKFLKNDVNIKDIVDDKKLFNHYVEMEEFFPDAWNDIVDYTIIDNKNYLSVSDIEKLDVDWYEDNKKEAIEKIAELESSCLW